MAKRSSFKMRQTVRPFQQRIEKPWGYELLLTPPDSPVAGKILFLKAGCRWSLQYHDQKEETLVLLTGKAKIILADQEYTLEPRKGYLIRARQKHRCRAISDCEIIEVSTPEKGKTVRLEDDYGRGDETEEMRQLPNHGWQKEAAHDQ
jgi:mannose-6-phosphate isomerase-like protein (cupin superfamily)